MFGIEWTVCPVCGRDKAAAVGPREVSHEDLTLFLVKNAGSRNWQALAEKLKANWNITLKENT